MDDLHDEEFRDRLGTVDEEGKRAWVYPKKPQGKLYEYRKTVSWFLLAFLIAAPFVKINGNQFLMFNVLERKFNIFGFPFWPQDFHLFVISMIIGVVFVALFTVAFGRIFCGWICPQTIFMEMVFRRIEYWIEGDRNAQIKLDKQEWNQEKIRKKGLKWFVFFVISFVIANVFLAYLTGSDELIEMVEEGPADNMGTLIALLIFTGVFYFIYIWFREQVCIIACPYGRLQGALLDNKTIVVAYDHVRGEAENGRGRIIKNEDRILSGKGDCIDCKLCVSVCPMGIDIRNGTQLECTNCTACIDECNTIMDKVGFPQGLIRYASEDEITKKEKFVFTTRMKGYAAVLLILTGVFSGMLFLRNDVEATVLRLPGQLFEHKGGNISNVFTYKVINKTTRDFNDVHFVLSSPKGIVKPVGAPRFKVPREGIASGTLFVEINPVWLKGDKTKITLEVYNGDKRLDTETTNFLGPRTFN
ncbi:cytochrome c oxidase accessory protein CcoG [Flavobacterium sp. MFBS3-15]|uniref:cytochrome c oxidase accessory protein CcoG n=1 Tax=Flavobacterium sp. MFBS3-15 TaxID=2989816 RepID=UPI0022355524|nr:cytochrome c oxidase accessory protein CcoG [Flavobacterium sp. MFBS3-15]MCW4469674.1 cytochrome c oxidase accessory protein CcoG [Flavobacterium sp. MFBS3-15]